ncbi:Hypothetical_protein [Hexamita inflata]|uniref:Hypothetical_protein n=1 Tax=Hexamita inflata TaxID=28002 RepID=A0AA86N895_9EUKA|nr:Hypothetical protein HINF_LOCUS2186 [Hexamita inflata]
MSSDALLQLKVNALLQREMQKVMISKGQNMLNIETNFEPEQEVLKQELNKTTVNQPLTQLNEQDKAYIVQYMNEHKQISTKMIIHYLTTHFKKEHKMAKSVIQQFIQNIVQEQQLNTNQVPDKQVTELITKSDDKQEQKQNKTKYQSTTEKLTEEAKQFITQYIKDHKKLTVNVLTFRMYAKYVTSKKMKFDRNEIQQYISEQFNTINQQIQQTKPPIENRITKNKSDQSQEQKNKLQQLVFHANTKIYQTVLQKMMNQDHSLKTPIEICITINSMEAEQFTSFWKMLQQYSSNSIEESKLYFYETYCRLEYLDQNNVDTQNSDQKPLNVDDQNDIHIISFESTTNE